MLPGSSNTDRAPVAVIVPREAWDDLGLQWETIAEALGSILAFLDYNAARVSVKVGKELSHVLSPPQGIGDAFDEAAECPKSATRLRVLFDLQDRIGSMFSPHGGVELDGLRLDQACSFVEVDLRSRLEECAAQYDVPMDALEAAVWGRLMFRRSGVPRCATGNHGRLDNPDNGVKRVP